MSKKAVDAFTDAEKAAFEWSRRRRGISRGRRRRSRSLERMYPKHHRNRRHDDSSDSDHPKDPFNPLKLAHNPRLRRQPSYVRRRSPSRRSNSPNQWEHDLYHNVEEQVAEESRYQRRRVEQDNTTHELDTRRGSWRSKAGGVYLPPDGSKGESDDLYSDYRRKRSRSPTRRSSRSRSYERPDPVYTLD
ncbi:uncharacterized protein BXIN_2194 [Babesia sp. Xinjiang]|uniref:uncharacterized protein n=1 Tax=Babesia sp. Xinjiang TaxID=462227 RepID=UPI000A25F5CB|nr:uncharacterized protein BXIN_2194 [Babesia sp. Xinjiang]ORM40355.1 hypothetical protein BXIN_2194 [Babesia sp. Xinjiang]